MDTSIQRTYPAGVTCWIDTEQPDPSAAQDFYGALFGWRFADAMPPDAPGSYFIATLDGSDVAAIGQGTAARVAWHTYVAVDDADATAAAVAAAGGEVLSPPADAGPAGRMAVCADPGGARFRLWQARARPGAQLTNDNGTWNFSHLRPADDAAACAFYRTVFGWQIDDIDGLGGAIKVPGYGRHLADTVDPGIYERQAGAPDGFADVVAGIQPLPAGEAPHWHVVFTVADRDVAAATVERLGGTVHSTADETWAKVAEVSDPQGARFTVSQFAPPSDF